MNYRTTELSGPTAPRREWPPWRGCPERLSVTERPDRLLHPLAMGARPVDSPASRASPEGRVAAPDEFGDLTEDLVLGPLFENRLATDAAARRRRCRIQAQGCDHLAELLHHMIAVDEEMRWQRLAAKEAGIPGQEDSALAPGLAQKVVVLTGRIFRIIPQNAQPPGQPTEHRIRQKPRDLSVSDRRPRTVIHACTLTHSPGFFIVRVSSARIQSYRTAAWDTETFPTCLPHPLPRPDVLALRRISRTPAWSIPWPPYRARQGTSVHGCLGLNPSSRISPRSLPQAAFDLTP